MRKQKYTILFTAAFLLIASNALFAESPSELAELFEKRRYFELREALAHVRSRGERSLLFYRAVVENKFNRPDRSIQLVERFLESPGKGAKRRMLVEAHTLLADNYVKIYSYSKAAGVYDLILTKFAADLSAQEKAGYENVGGLWKALASVPPQTTEFRGDSLIQAKQERVGLYVPLEINGQSESFIFDTGANVSTIIESHAKKLGLEIYESDVEVGSISGNKVRSRLGVAKQLKFGNITLRNVVFLVFPDESLYIKPLNFQIHGILGFPAIEALGQVTWTRDKRIIIPSASGRSNLNNLAFDGLTPLIRGSYGGRSMTFAFDTGANTSTLYPVFFKTFEKEIIADGGPVMEKVTGAGGRREIKAYRLPDSQFEFAGRKAAFKRLQVLTEETSGASRYFYGNIGRDLIGQFNRMTINFDKMSIAFE